MTLFATQLHSLVPLPRNDGLAVSNTPASDDLGNRAKRIYEERYCPRAKCENWIKELKTYLHCDRTSCQEFDANQVRLLLHTFAYVLLWEIRRKAQMRHSTVETVRLQLNSVLVVIRAFPKQRKTL